MAKHRKPLPRVIVIGADMEDAAMNAAALKNHWELDFALVTTTTERLLLGMRADGWMISPLAIERGGEHAGLAMEYAERACMKTKRSVFRHTSHRIA